MEVHYKCIPDAQSFIVSVKEAATCNYILTVGTNLLCKHPFYRPREDDSLAIGSCLLIVAGSVCVGLTQCYPA